MLIRKKRRLLLKCCWNLVLWAPSGDLSLGLLWPKLCHLSQSLLGGWQCEWVPSSILSVPWRQWYACVFVTQMKHFLHPLPLFPEFIFSNNPIIISENYSFSDSLVFKFSSVVQSWSTLCDPMDCSMSGFPVHHQLPELAQTHVHRVGDAIQPPPPLSSHSPPAFNLAQHQSLFQWVSPWHQVAKAYWNFSFSISPSNKYSGLISFRIDWFDLFAVQRTLKNHLQHHSSKASILWHSAFFMVQLSHPYMTTGKTIALTRWTFVSKVMSLLFNMLFMLVITFLPRSKHLLIAWLQSPSSVTLEPKKIKSLTVSPSICHEVMGPDVMIFIFWMLNFKPAFSLSSFTFIKRLFSSSSLSAIKVVSSASLRFWYFSQKCLVVKQM